MTPNWSSGLSLFMSTEILWKFIVQRLVLQVRLTDYFWLPKMVLPCHQWSQQDQSWQPKLVWGGSFLAAKSGLLFHALFFSLKENMHILNIIIIIIIIILLLLLLLVQHLAIAVIGANFYVQVVCHQSSFHSQLQLHQSIVSYLLACTFFVLNFICETS